MLNEKADEITADIIIEGATFYCGKNIDSNYDFLAVKDNKIIGLGKNKDIQLYKGKNTVTYSFSKDNLVIPGLHDNHIHLVQSGMLDKYVDLSKASSEEEAVAMTYEFSKSIPDEKWVIGFGWSRFAWENKQMPSKKSLDRVISERPVLLFDTELHAAWANSEALKLSNVDSNTKDPDFGKIERDESGEPTGYLYEMALSLVAKHAFEFEESIVKDLIKRYCKKAASYGITSVTDMTPYLGINLAYEDVFMKMDRDNELTIRINAARDLFEDINEVVKLRKKAEQTGSGMYRIPFFKQFIDGIISNYTALMLEDYSDSKGNKGGTLLDLKKLDESVKVAHQNQMSVRLHACGDGAVRAALDSYEKAIKEGGASTSRHQIEHIEVIDKKDIPRFKELGVIASVQPEHIVSGMPSFKDNGYPEILGKERERYTWPFKSLKEAGAILAGGSDSPVVEGSPFVGIYCGLERLHPDKTPEGGWNQEEKLNIEDMIQMYTYGAAFAEGREEELGTLELGKLADITVLDRNILKSNSEKILGTKVMLTMVDGKVVY